MAIDDIVAKILADAEAEAGAIVAAAEEDAQRVVAEATARGEADAARRLERERAKARTDAETLLANARLSARDAGLTARLGLAAQALTRAEALLLALPDAEYAALLARGVAESATGRETVLVASADADRLRSMLPAALAAAGVKVEIGSGQADTAHGVVLAGGGVRVEVSPAAWIASRRDELLAESDRLLFPREV